MKNLYLPTILRIKEIENQSPTVKLLRLAPKIGNKLKKDKHGFVARPGQFILLGDLGWGEAPFGVLSSPYEDSYIEVLVRRVRKVTSYLHSLKVGDDVMMRGPFGNGFDLRKFKDKDILCAIGGCGIPPVAALIEYIIKNRNDFRRATVAYGARDSSEILIKDRMKEWEKFCVDVVLTVDNPSLDWHGHVGFATELLDDIKIDCKKTAVVMCGPDPMIQSFFLKLRECGIKDKDIYASLERKMQCGVGKCQHCACGNKYVCVDGPVFSLDEIKKFHD